MSRELSPLPLAQTSVRVALIGDAAQQLVFSNPDRRYYLVQNQSTTDSVLLTSTQNGNIGLILGPTGAEIVDAPTVNALWARKSTNNAPDDVPVTVKEIVGYSPWEIRMLNALETLVELYAAGAPDKVRAKAARRGFSA